MLANVLPGLRETRTSFALGVAHITWLVLLVAAFRPAAFESSQVSPQLRDLIEWLGKPFALAVISFGVYLFGHLLLTSARSFGDRVTRRAFYRPGVFWWYTRSTHSRLATLVEKTPQASGSVIGSVVRSSRTQLLRANKDLYERMQTRRYAALLRFGVAPSVPLVVGSAMLHVSWPAGAEIALVVGSLPVAVALWLEAVREYSISLAILVREVSAERVELELMKAKPANED